MTEYRILSLSNDEYAVLMIANEGRSVAPIGRWEKPVESLVARGLLHRHDKFNNSITPEGKSACEARADEDVRSMVDLSVRQDGKAQEVQGNIQDFIQQAARHMAEAAKASSLLTGDTAQTAARRWNALLLERTLELL